MSARYQHANLSYYVSTDITDFDLALVHKWLSVDAYWSQNIPQGIVKKAFSNSLAFGMFKENGVQVGVARMVTDCATFGYLADVFIVPEERGQGLAKWLMTIIMEHPELQGLRRVMLATSDMHPLYRQFGFKDVDGSDLLMEIVHKDIYQEQQT